MNAKERRKQLIDILNKNDKPVKGTDIAKKLKVSRQVIVQDVAILRAAGKAILATPQGYLITKEYEKDTITSTIACRHNNSEIEEELDIILNYGGKILDVVVEHPVYGEIRSQLQINSRDDLYEFLKNLETTNAEPLAALTDGVHIHTIEVKDDETLSKIKSHADGGPLDGEFVAVGFPDAFFAGCLVGIGGFDDEDIVDHDP